MTDIADITLNANILIVDDKPENVQLLEMMLSLSGYTNVQSTTDPRDVLGLYQDNDFDIILLDIRMPHLDGFQVMEQLSENIKGDYLPILVLTAQDDMETRLKALEAGASDFVTKPFDKLEVLNRISNMIKVRYFYNERSRTAELMERKVSERTRELHDTRLMIIQRLGRAGEYRDNETGMHVIRMSKASQILSLAAGLGQSHADLILNASPMHDVGKIGIPDAILLKPGKLDRDEFDIIKTHPEIGADIIGDHDIPLMRTAKSIAITHHEKWDGTGYPNGIKGKDIPIEGRITAVCDVFDALTSKRPYKDAWPVDKAMSLINEGAGKHFDPQLVKLFNDILPDVIIIGEQYSDADGEPTPSSASPTSERVIFQDSFLIGNEEIDKEHRKLFEIINAVHDAILDGDIYLCEKLFESFNNTAAGHFKAEERILAKSKFPRFKEHCAYHRELIIMAEETSAKCKNMKDKENLLKCFDELIQFFMDDVLLGDLEFKSHLLETGFAVSTDHKSVE